MVADPRVPIRLDVTAGRHSLRLVFAGVLLVSIALLFWTQSRYPSLDDKALMSGSIVLEDPLSFEAHEPVHAADPLWRRVLTTTTNWYRTNLVGMTFGVLFGAAFLALLRHLPRRGFRSGPANALLGFLTGAPLGVCVNCAAPVARGAFAGGARLETALAMMIASPTFNVVVVTMLIGLFPLYLVAIKLAASAAVALVAVPLLCRLVPADELLEAGGEVCPVAPGAAEGEGEPPLRALRGFAADFARDLVFIVRVTVPWMLAAGLLGALVATLLPVQAVAGLPVTWITLLGVALLGVFLPVPIAFDVILAAALLAAGVPVAFVMTLLFTLGIFSVYSFAIVAGSMSRRAALYLVAVIAATGVASGRLAESYGAWEVERTLALLADEGEVLAAPLPAPGGDDAPEPSPAAGARAALVPFAVRAEGGGGAISVARSLFAPRSPAGERAFTRLEAHHRGVDRPNLFSIQDMKFPFVQAPGSIAAADLDGDGDPDLVVADNHRGVDVFHNDGHGHFTRAGLNLREVSARSVIIAAPVDVDDDGWLDLFLTTYREGNLLLRNDRGRFRNSGVERVGGRPGAVLANAVGFGDIDRDGDLDAVLGHYSGFAVFHARDARDRNRILFNEGGALSGERFADTAAVPGETLSVLLSDFDGDGDLDLIEGNDFEEPDAFHLGDGRGGFGKIRSEDGLIPVSAHTTMSIKTADLDNDLRMEIYVSQIAGRSENVSERLRLSSWDDYCRGIERPEDQAACQVNVDIRRWYPVATFRMDLRMARNCADLPAKARAECRAVLIRDIAVRTGRPGLCREIPRAQVRTRQLCELNARARIDPLATAEPEDGRQELLVTNRSYPGEIPQFFGGNVLLVDRGDGRFEDRARPAGLDIGGWSWDVKIHDFDLDGLQDVHIHNGAWQPEVVPSKIYKKNLGGMRFAETTEEAGLVDFLIVTSSAAADFDGDGDIDQIAQTLNGPLVAYWNNAQEGHAIAFAFRDEIGNHFGIGNKVVIHYGEAGRQIRELQLSGGYCSFDPPVAHFGLGAHDAVERVEVEWSTGERSILEGPFPAGATYRITRAEPAVAR